MITVVGLGIVGLTTALGFAEKGYDVTGVEKDKVRRETIASGKVPFYEEGLEKPLTAHTGKNFIVSDSFEAVKKSDYIFFCVGTPAGEDGEADLTHLYAALDESLGVLSKEKKNVPIIVVKSTVPPSTTFGKVAKYIENKGFVIGKDVYLANNPEFLREGYCWEDFMYPGRIVIGAEDEYTRREMRKLYEPFKAPIHTVSGNTAEFIKYVSNSMLATMISFSNEMAEVADSIGNIETAEAFHILHEDERWNNAPMKAYIYPGCGYGGYCLPKDTVALSKIAKNYGTDTAILNQVIERNNSMAQSIANRIAKSVGKNDVIGILGLSFKPGSDDVRESASAKVIKKLIEMGYTRFVAYDPVANLLFKQTYSFSDSIKFTDSAEKVIKESQMAVILTGWEEFKSICNDDRKKVLDFRYIL